MEHDHPRCHPQEEGHHQKLWYRTPLFLTTFVTLCFLAFSYLLPFLSAFRTAFFDYLRMMGFPIAAGFIVGGFVDYYVPKEYIVKYLALGRKRTILYSTGLGFLMTACSHGIIALSMELHKKGASGPAVVSFLLASPWANLPITFLLIGFFGWKGIVIVVSALFVSVTTGLIFQMLDRKGWIEQNRNAVSIREHFSIRQDITRRIKEYRFSISNCVQDLVGVAKGIYMLADMVLWWVIVGALLASFVSAFVPSHIFHRFLGPSFLGLLATLGVATILEICSEGTAPLAFEIYKQTGALGNAFAFLMGGVVTDYTEVGLVWMNLGKKTALWMLAITIPQVLLLGWIFNFLFSS